MQYVVPAFAHRLAIDTPSQNELSRVNTHLKQEVKKIMHLHPSTTDSLLYTRKKGRRTWFSPSGAAGPAVRTSSCDRTSGHGGPPASGAGTAWRLAGLRGEACRATPVPISSDTQRPDYGQAGMEGRRVPEVDDSACPRTAINRTAKNNVTLCRRCCLKPETLGHVIGECSAGQRARIDTTESWEPSKRTVRRKDGPWPGQQQQFNVGEDRLRPDLVVNQRDRVLIVDVTLPYENGASLSAAALKKVTTYQPLPRREVIPVVVGTRGALPQATVTGLKKLGITKRRTLMDFTLMAIRISIDICRGHLDYG
ncbi:uncharacterized protein LOC124370427 [Homalodisca vitripennis]|uniref:uncharacterized protein LOC124370427 n=1 Tax=Homalodisca vitripennis TaxID=197043 RepID=UPI001EEC91A4|nr:uncharacterized protein LOC124370427 [Homalodisca vitripennis]